MDPRATLGMGDVWEPAGRHEGAPEALVPGQRDESLVVLVLQHRHADGHEADGVVDLPEGSRAPGRVHPSQPGQGGLHGGGGEDRNDGHVEDAVGQVKRLGQVAPQDH